MFKTDKLRFGGALAPVAALLLCGAASAHPVMVSCEYRLVRGEVVGVDHDGVQTKAAYAIASCAPRRRLQSCRQRNKARLDRREVSARF